MARTLAELQTEYTKVKTAYDKAIEAQSYTFAVGEGSRTVSRPDIDKLKRHMDSLAEEIDRRINGGITVRGITPIP